MRIGVLGTGSVGRTIGGKLVELGYEVCMGSRSAGNETAAAWSDGAGPAASAGTFAEAAEFGELAFNCTAGAGALDAVGSAAAELAGMVLVDVSNPLEFPDDGPPTLFVGLDDSLGEQVQRALPDTRVVKALNTMNYDVMVDPGLVPGNHVAFVCGDDGDAKAQITELLGALGWPAERVIDCGGIDGARATEGFLLIWLRLMGHVGGGHFNIALQQAR